MLIPDSSTRRNRFLRIRMVVSLMLASVVGCATTPTRHTANRISLPTVVVANDSDETRSVTDAAPAAAPLVGAASTQTSTDGDADVIEVIADQTSEGTWDFHVTVKHRDRGWSHYMDGWNIVLPDGTIYLEEPDDKFTRRMFHPHLGEPVVQRSKLAVALPNGVNQVTVKAHDSKHGFGGKEVVVSLNEDAGDCFTVRRASP